MNQNLEGFAKYCDCGEYLDVCEGWKCNGETMEIKKAEEIAEDIVTLTKSTDSQEELKDAWSVINKAMRYLSSKDDYLTHEMEVQKQIERMKDAKKEEGN